ncbi:hypothetical protein B9T31_12145 [Acinetobacter sp. ANC 4558]|uniref:hypothetical protein n=1 Tax=Acinetobacter sp. ANC 4558 TaxID=1977876 RepID=UPI000A3359E1|nr:hypothetical protein [Acinetobacter sp. ANC 4558]OTG85535.1 hypothetical protein B9T31_12145 [Acinetobacter sp. ANC 4558]
MKIIYAKKSTGINEDGLFMNPKYFERPDSNASSVVIYGDYPEIKAAYAELGVTAEVRGIVEKSSIANISIAEKEQSHAQLKGVVPQDVYDEVYKDRTRLEQEVVGIKADLEKVTGERDALIIQVGELQAIIDSAQSANDAPTAVETEQAVQENQVTPIDYSAWTIEQIKVFLADKNIGFKASSTKPELLALIPKG